VNRAPHGFFRDESTRVPPASNPTRPLRTAPPRTLNATFLAVRRPVRLGAKSVAVGSCGPRATGRNSIKLAVHDRRHRRKSIRAICDQVGDDSAPRVCVNAALRRLSQPDRIHSGFPLYSQLKASARHRRESRALFVPGSDDSITRRRSPGRSCKHPDIRSGNPCSAMRRHIKKIRTDRTDATLMTPSCSTAHIRSVISPT